MRAELDWQPRTGEPARFPLNPFPSPLLPAAALSDALGGPELWIKRDDLIPFGLGGNKVRALELILADALEEGADTLVTGAGPLSNHVRATAAAAAHTGLRMVAVYLGQSPARSRRQSLFVSTAWRRDPLHQRFRPELRRPGAGRGGGAHPRRRGAPLCDPARRRLPVGGDRSRPRRRRNHGAMPAERHLAGLCRHGRRVGSNLGWLAPGLPPLRRILAGRGHHREPPRRRGAPAGRVRSPPRPPNDLASGSASTTTV